MKRLIFVYGTLKRGCVNHHWMGGQQFVGMAQTQPCYRLYDLGGYPGVVLDEKAGIRIDGEVWEVTEEGLERLDELEEVERGEYLRVNLKMEEKWKDHRVLGYLYLLPLGEATEVSSGVWVE